MAQNRESLSELSKRRTSWILSILGLIVLILFITVLCSLRPKKEIEVPRPIDPNYTLEKTTGTSENDGEVPQFGDQNAQLVVTPSEVVLENVVLGSLAESVLVLRAENGPLLLRSKTLAENAEEGFMLSGPCMEKTHLDEGEECVLKVSWQPSKVQTIQNILTIKWKEDNLRVPEDSKTQIQLKASSTDSKECVCCEIEKEREEKIPRKAVTIAGEPVEVTDHDTVIYNGKEIPIEGEIAIDLDSGDIIIVEPKRIALNLKNEYLGRVTEYRTVLDAKGNTLGRLLGDDTLVDADFNVIGAAIPLVSVLNAKGAVIGKLDVDETSGEFRGVVNAEGAVIGMPRVDMTVVDKTGAVIGTLRPWGMALDLSGNLMGGILPTGAVVATGNKTVGYIQQNGFVLSETGALIGGVVPKGIAVGTGCRSYGALALNGQVKDEYGQIVGRVMLDGGVVDTKFNEIGHAVNQGLIVSMKGDIVGFVNSEGKAVDGHGTLLGCVAPNGSVAAGKTMIGAALQKGVVVGNTCGVVGSVYPDAKVMSLDVREMGKVRSDGYAINAAKKVIGLVVPHGTVMAEGCRLVGTIALTGQVLNEQNMSVGCINAQKQAVDNDGKEIGKITPTGPVLAADGTLIGRVRYDGRIIDKQGKIVDCVSPDGPSVAQEKGAVLDDNGLLTPWTVLAGKCFNEKNDEIGTVVSNGWVMNKQGRLIGFMPPDSLIFSPAGLLLGRYNRFMGSVLDLNGESFGRLMPDGTVLDKNGTKILGAAIAQNATFVSLDGTPLGRLTLDGSVVGESGSSLGRVFADGSLYSNDNKLLGGVLASGVVLSADGTQIGWANTNGDVLTKGTRIANLLPNGLAVTPDNRIVGRVCPPASVLVAARGVVGTIVPKAVGNEVTAYQLAAYDKVGSYMGVMSPFGVMLGVDGRLGGVAVPVSMVLDLYNHLMGWVNFSGQVVDSEGQVRGLLGPNGLVFNADGALIGHVLRKGVMVDEMGKFVGHVSADGLIYNGTENTGMFVGISPFVFNNDFTKTIQLLPEGIAVASNGKVLGWTGFDGAIVNSEQTVGSVVLSHRVVDGANNVIAGFVPLGAASVQEDEKMCGIVNEQGLVLSATGRSLGEVWAPDYVVQNDVITGHLKTNSLFVRDVTDSELLGVMDLDGLIYKQNTARQVGSFMMNDFVVNSAKKITAGLVPFGFAISTNLKSIGTEDLTGLIWSVGKKIGATSGVGFISEGVNIAGGIFAPESIIDKSGAEIGRTNASGDVVDRKGQKIATRMAFYSALTPETIWAGGPLKTGMVIDDYARKVGIVTADGTLMKAGVFSGRILPDGSAAGVSERALYNTMPYVGHLTTQGVPVGYSGKVLGRTTVQGDLIDSSDHVIYQMLDDGTVLGTEKPLEGIILTFRSAVSHHDEVLGIFDGDAQLMVKDEMTHVATNGALVPESSMSGSMMDQLKELGGLIPETLIVNDSCAVIGQTSYMGEVVNGQGNTVGRVLPTLVAVDSQGRVIGHAVHYGPITTMDEKGAFVGRTLPDSTVVDPAGVSLGCVRSDDVLVDVNGNELGRLRDRGPVFDDVTHKMEGRVDAMGRVVCMNGEICGTIGGKDSDVWYDNNGKRRGAMFSKSDRLILDENGLLKGAVNRDGWIKNDKGDRTIRIDQGTGNLYNKDGVLLGNLNGNGESLVFLYDMQDKMVGRLLGCELRKLSPDVKMGMVLANGEIRDDDDDVILTTTADGKVYNPDGTQFGYFGGIGLDLRRCGLATLGSGQSSRPIKLGGKTFELDPVTGMITDPKGKVVGVWDASNNRPYLWDEEKEQEEEMREPPALPAPYRFSPDVINEISNLQYKRRTQMKEKIGAQGSLVLPGYNVEEMAKAGTSSDWSSVGTGKESISTWPVDMSRVLLADKAVPAVLVRSIDSRYPDVPVTAIVERHIYAEAGRNILIPAGSRLIGKLNGSSAFEFGRDQAAKVDIEWKRLIRPDGAAFKFEAVTGDAQGRGGAAAYLDLQLMKKFALPFVSSLGEGMILKMTELNEKNSVASATTSGSGGTTSETAASQTRKMFIDNFKDIWDELMSMAGEVPNIVYVPSGTRLTAFSSVDLWLRSDDDPPEKKSDSVKPDVKAGTFYPSNASWINKRNDERGAGTSGGSDASDGGSVKTYTSEKTEAIPSQTPEQVSVIYTPPDLEERVVEPVNSSVDIRKQNSYF